MDVTSDPARHATQGVSETAATSHGNASDVGLLADEIDTTGHELLATTRKAFHNWASFGSALHIARPAESCCEEAYRACQEGGSVRIT